MELGHVALRHDGFADGLEDRIAPRVVGMMVGVEDDVHQARVPLRQAGEAECSRVRKLRVHDHERLLAGEPADGAAATDEEADIAPEPAELDGDRRGRSCRRCGGGRRG